MMVFRRACMLALMVAVGAGIVTPRVQAAPTRQSSTQTYHDPAFTFSYPADWTIAPSSNLASVKSLLASYKDFRVTDIGMVSSGWGPGSDFGAAILVVRLRLTRSLRTTVMQERGTFMRSFIKGAAFVTRKVLARGSTTLGGLSGRMIEFLQGSGKPILHQRVYVLLAPDAKRMFLVYFIALKSNWAQFLPAFTAAATSMQITPD